MNMLSRNTPFRYPRERMLMTKEYWDSLVSFDREFRQTSRRNTMIKKTMFVALAVVTGVVLAILILSSSGCGGTSGDSYAVEDAGTDTDVDTDKSLQGMWECLICN